MMSGNPCILLVEDDENDFFLFRRALNQSGITTPFVHVSNGRKAISYLTGQPPYIDRAVFPLPTLIVSDLKMRGMDGLELLAWVRSQPDFCKLPFVVLCSSARIEDIQAAHLLGTNDYRVKPRDFEELIGIVRDLHFQWLSQPEFEPSPVVPRSFSEGNQQG